MLIGFSIDDSEHEVGASALLEELVNEFGFEPRLDVPLCLEYFDGYETNVAYTNLCATVYHNVVHDVSVCCDDEIYNSAVMQVSELIKDTCRSNGIDYVLLQGIDIIIIEDASRVIIWFNQEDLGWKPQN